MAITHNENPLSFNVGVCVVISQAGRKGLGANANIQTDTFTFVYFICLSGHAFLFHYFEYLVGICARGAGCSPWCFLLFVLFICMQQSGCWRCWSLQVAGIHRLVIRLRANWVAALRMYCGRLSQNYPWIIPQNYAIPVWPCPLKGLGRGRVLDSEGYAARVVGGRFG